MNSFHVTVPSENWDDDFEFQPTQTKHPNDTKHANEYLPNRMSIASLDWDAPHDDEDEDMKPPKILGDKKNLTHWAEQLAPTSSTTPQTPTWRTHASTKSTENWDDDFRYCYSIHHTAD